MAETSGIFQFPGSHQSHISVLKLVIFFTHEIYQLFSITALVHVCYFYIEDCSVGLLLSRSHVLTAIGQPQTCVILLNCFHNLDILKHQLLNTHMA